VVAFKEDDAKRAAEAANKNVKVPLTGGRTVPVPASVAAVMRRSSRHAAAAVSLAAGAFGLIFYPEQVGVCSQWVGGAGVGLGWGGMGLACLAVGC